MILSKIKSRLVIQRPLLILVTVTTLFLFAVSATYADRRLSRLDFTEGGHVETDTGTTFMAEWWYFNGKLDLVAKDGEQRQVGWFSVVGHQESPTLSDGSQQLSHVLKFSALYNEDGSNHLAYTDTFIPRSALTSFVGIHTPYLFFSFPATESRAFGAANTGYTVSDTLTDGDTNIEFTLSLKAKAEKTIEDTSAPLPFKAFERGVAKIGGSVTIDGKQFLVKRGTAYIDHMIPAAEVPWPMTMHGWSWAEVTTNHYQAIIYATRSLQDGPSAYAYKHVTILDRRSGKVLDQFYDNEVEIIESDWQPEPGFNTSRPGSVIYKAGAYEISVTADNVAVFDQTTPDNIGFVDFMAFQQRGAQIRFHGRVTKGDGFYEYLVSDVGRTAPVVAINQQ